MSAPDPLARPTRKTIAAALDALAIATPAEICAAADLLDGEDGRETALIGLLGAAVALGRHNGARADADGADRADIAVAKAEDALDLMRQRGA